MRQISLIGIRYCGGCNPQIDRSRVVEKLVDELGKRGADVDFSTDRDSLVDLTILINGCIRSCLEEDFPRSFWRGPCLSVRGEMLGKESIAERDLPLVLAEQIAALLSRRV